MNFGKVVRVLLLAAPLLTGCAGFWQNPNSTSTSSGCTTDCTTDSSGNFYILAGGSTPQVQGESIVSGVLTAISGSPWDVTYKPWTMAITPNGNYLYVSTEAGVYMYPITSGSLGTATQIDSADTTVYAMQVDGNWLIEAVQETGEVMFNAVPLNSTNGSINGTIQTAPFIATTNLPSVETGQMALTPDGTTVFVSLGTGGTIYFPFAPGDSATTNPFGSSTSAPLIPVVTSGASALSVAVDPGGILVYIGETLLNASSTTNTGGIRALQFSALPTVTNVSGSPIGSGGAGPNFILPVGDAASGSYIYVANASSGNITSISVTPSTSSGSSTYTLATGSTVSAYEPLALAEDSEDNFILAATEGYSPGFLSYTFDSTTAGLLDIQITANTGAAPVAIVAAP